MDVTYLTIKPKKIIGLAVETCAATDHEVTSRLWRDFIDKKATIENKVNLDSLSIKVTDANFSFENLKNPYQKGAAVEVSEFYDMVSPLSSRTLSGGLYAVFLFSGPANKFSAFFSHILTEWLPKSEYDIDFSREQFEVLAENYRPNDRNATEKIWIPIQ